MSATPSVTSVRAAFGHEFLPPQMGRALAAPARTAEDLDVVNEVGFGHTGVNIILPYLINCSTQSSKDLFNGSHTVN